MMEKKLNEKKIIFFLAIGSKISSSFQKLHPKNYKPI